MQGLVSLLQYCCEIRAVSLTIVPFLFPVSPLKGGEIGRESSGCQSVGLWCLQGQHDKNSIGSDSSMHISLVSRQLFHRNRTEAVQELLNN